MSASASNPPESHRSGYVALIGRPNAGKSTLMNSIIGSKVSIATHKPQTTRHQIMGIWSDEASQIIFLDTPGVLDPSYALQSAMMRFVEKARNDADLVLLIVDGTDSDPPEEVIALLKSLNVPILLVINKMDLIGREEAERLAEETAGLIRVDSTHFVSALTGEGIEVLMERVKQGLPPGPAYYPKDILSEQPVRFFAAELIREQIYLLFHEEIPYSCTVDVIQYEEREDLDYIGAEIIVNRNSQKGILIGKGGKAVRELGVRSREAIEEFVGRPVYLDLHVKVREKWREQENWVRNLGYR